MAEKELTPDEVKAIQAENKKLVSELIAANEAVAKANAVLEENATLKEAVKSLNDELALKEQENEELGSYPILTHKGKKYELIDAKSRARFEGKNIVITLETLKEDKKLIEHCIKKGYSCLREKGGN
jgi:hypothetical protein